MEHEDAGLDGDRSLARRIAGGDRDALDAFTGRYVDAVFAFALRERGEVAEAEALTERALARVVAAMDEYAGDAPLAARVYAMARAEALRMRSAPARRASAGCGTGSAWSPLGDERPR